MQHLALQWEIEEDLFSTFYQLWMPEFIIDVEQYITELTTSTNPQVPPSAPPSLLSPETELAIQCIELGHEVQTSGTIYGKPINTPLSHIHPHYQEACFECHHLGHVYIHCWWYIYPIYKVTAPGHPQHRCPLNHHSSCTSSSSSSSSSQPRPIPPPHSHRMVPENSVVRLHNPCSCSPPYSHSPLEDFEYDNVAIAKMTSSPVSSFADF